MAKETSTSYIFAKRPTADIIPGETFSAVTSPAPTEADLQDGEVIFETHYLSLDPSMRVWLKGIFFKLLIPLMDFEPGKILIL